MKLTDKTTLLCIISGLITLFFTGGHWSIPVMAWIFSIPFLVISRNFHKKWKGLLIVFLIILLGSIFKNPGLILNISPAEQIASSIVGLTFFLPFLADRFIGEKFYSSNNTKIRFIGTLIFPSAFALTESCLTLMPWGYINSLSATQADNLPLLQFASVLGGSGIVFIVSWTASLVLFVVDSIRIFFASSSADNIHHDKRLLTNHYSDDVMHTDIQHSDDILSVRKCCCIALSVYLLVFAFGGARIAFDKSDSDADISCIAMAKGAEIQFGSNGWEKANYKEVISCLNEAVKKASESDAEMLVFCEEALGVESDKENKLKTIISEKAKKSGLYIVAGIESYNDNPNDRKNLMCMFSPKGKLIYNYQKSILIPFIETGYYGKGDGIIPVQTLKLNSKNSSSCVSSAICFEGEYSHYLNKITEKVDIHLNPSWEWFDACGFHTDILKIRAVELGASLIKPTRDGPSIATDYLGRTVSYSNADSTDCKTVSLAYVPAHGIKTFYHALKHVINWIYIIPLAGFALYSRKRLPIK